MLVPAVSFLALFLTSLLVGSMFAVWLMNAPAGLSAADYIAMQQRTIRALNLPLPLMGLASILLTLACAWFARPNPSAMAMLAGAAVLLVVSGVITRFLNQPINAEVMTWSAAAPPATWEQLRDAWWTWHLVRLAAGLAALALLIGTHLRAA